MTSVNKWMLDPMDSVMCLIDHQSGLFQLVKDIEISVLRTNVIALSKMAHLSGIPTLTTASVPDGPNGPLIPEINQYNPDAVYIPRTGQINAWDNPAWVKAIEVTKRRTLLIAGTLTSVCMSFPALSAVVAGYKVFTIIDASGNWSKMATDITLARVTQAGAIPIDTFAVLGEVMGTWNREDAMEFASIMVDLLPNYKLLMESYDKAQSVQKFGRETRLEHLEPAHAK